MSKVKKGDEVIIITGKDKGKSGKILRVIPGKFKVIIEGLNLIKKHLRPNPQAGIQGGIISREAAIDISNVAPYNVITKKADKIGYKILEDGRKVRYYKSNNELVDS